MHTELNKKIKRQAGKPCGKNARGLAEIHDGNFTRWLAGIHDGNSACGLAVRQAARQAEMQAGRLAVKPSFRHFASCTSVLSVLLSVLILCSGCAGGLRKTDAPPKVIKSACAGEDLHTQGKLKAAVKSGLYELYYDEKTLSFSLKDTAGNFWDALPKKKNKSASLLNIGLSNGKETYILNSQDNALAYGKAKIRQRKDGLDFIFVFSEKKNSPKFKVPLTLKLRLADGRLSASVDLSGLKKNAELSGFRLSFVEILPYFGAGINCATGDYLIIPDGSGGLIDLSKPKNSSYETYTYGTDPAVAEYSPHPAVMGLFGLKRSRGAFAGIVTEGEALSKICANTFDDGSYNIFASFDVTPNALNRLSEDKYLCALGGDSYEGKLSVSYRFINGSAAEYPGLAAVCREELLRDGSLSTRNAGSSEFLPLNLTLIGAERGLAGTRVHTSFENVRDIAEVLKAKGINALNIKYDAALSGGLKQEPLKKARLSGRLGSAADFEELCNYLRTQDFNLYMNIRLFSSSSGGPKAKGVLSRRLKFTQPNVLSPAVGPESFELYGLSAESLEKNTVKFMKHMNKYDIPGYCIGDAGTVLYSDMSDGFTDRQSYSDSIFNQIIALSADKKLMTEHGNLYTLKNALLISQLPMGVSYEESESYRSVPFIQAVLHGTVEYTGEYLNLSKEPEKALLRSLEYGALPAFVWTYDDEGKDDEASKLYFENQTKQALSVYESFNSVLGDLRGARITGHSKISEGVYCTEYNNESSVYVNYTDRDAYIGNLTVKAGSFLRVN